MKRTSLIRIMVCSVLCLTGCASGTGGKNESAKIADSGKKILVAYFSATNNTKGVAEKIAGCTGADLYRIEPSQPYTSADLDYNDKSSRSTIEQNDKNARPEITGTVGNWESYDVVFLGYPIWWYDAPRIMSTFVESYDFSGKTVEPFCTSGGSSIGDSGKNLEALADGGKWVEGKRLTGKDNITGWINGLDL